MHCTAILILEYSRSITGIYISCSLVLLALFSFVYICPLSLWPALCFLRFLCRDVLPFTLKLPEAVTAAKTQAELEELAQLGAGTEWLSLFHCSQR